MYFSLPDFSYTFTDGENSIAKIRINQLLNAAVTTLEQQEAKKNLKIFYVLRR